MRNGTKHVVHMNGIIPMFVWIINLRVREMLEVVVNLAIDVLLGHVLYRSLYLRHIPKRA